MPVKINPRGTPLPDGHPLKGGCIIFGQKRPGSSAKPSAPTAEPSSNSLPPFEAGAHKSYESAMWDRFEQATGNKRPEEAPSLESTTPGNPENPSPDTSTEQE